MNEIGTAKLVRFSSRRLTLAWVLAAAWLVCIAWSGIAPATTAGTVTAGLQFLFLLLLLFVQGSIAHGWRGVSLFVVILCAVSFAFEATSIATGFPFGFFTHHTPGPRLLGVPMAVLLGYAVYGWLAWVQTHALLDGVANGRRRLFLLAAPIVGSFVLAGYDYPWDAIGATVLHTHSYRSPTGLFGVPLSNFLGWLLTGWAAFQLVTLAERGRPAAPLASTRRYLLIAPVVWIGLGLSYLLRFWSAPAGSTAVGGRTFVIADIYEASAAIALPAMILPAVIAIVMVLARTEPAHEPR